MIKSKKAYAVIALVAILAFSLSGCIHMTANLKINADGSADYGMNLLMADSLTSMAGASGTDVWSQSTSQFKDEGYDVKDVKDDGYSGISVTKHYKSVSDIQSGDVMSTGGLMPSANSAFKADEKKGLFATTYNVSMKLDVSDTIKQATAGLGTLGTGDDTTALTGDDTDTTDDSTLTDTTGDGTSLDTDAMTKMMISQMRLNFVVTLPVKAASNNATSVSADGLTYTWNLALDKPNDLQLSASVPNMTNIYLVSGGALLIVLLAAGLIILFVLRGKKKKMQASVAASSVDVLEAVATEEPAVQPEQAAEAQTPVSQPPVEM